MGGVKKAAKSIGKSVKKVVSNPLVGGAVGFALGGPAGAALGAAGSGLLAGGLGGDEKEVATGGTTLTPEGLAQFNSAGGQLENLFAQGNISAAGGDFSGATNAFNSINFGGINDAIGSLNNFTGTDAAKNAISRVGDFTGTDAAKDALNNIAGFRGSEEAFRTLAALEQFGADEQQFVTDARQAVLSFDEGFQSQALPLLQQAAEGQFLTEAQGNPFLADMIETAQRPVVEAFNTDVLPNLLGTFAGTGGVGSTLGAGFANQAANDLQRNLGDIGTTLSFNTFESEREKQLAAQQAILGFENQGLDRQLQARTTNLSATQQSAALMLEGLQSAGNQATALSGQELAALQAAASGELELSSQQLQALSAAASGEVALSGQAQASLAAALQGQLGAGQLKVSQGSGLAGIASNQQSLNIANAQLEADRINQLLQFQQNSGVAGSVNFENLVKPGI